VADVIDRHLELSRRIALLDEERGDPPFRPGPVGDLARFVAVLSEVTRPGSPDAVRSLPIASAGRADEIVAGCRLLGRLLDAAPEITAGPVRLGAQRWIATGKPAHVAPSHPVPSQDRFVGAPAAGPMPPDAKPFGLGLFTSTAVFGGHGAWRAYLDLQRGSSLFPPPWYTWAVELEPDATVMEVSSAAEWVDLVESHPLRAGGLTYPDWASLGGSCDGVHMTVRAIAATQGIVFQLREGFAAPPYWDVESTLWLRWRVRSAELMDVTTWPAADHG
jgi:hypothetical protein